MTLLRQALEVRRIEEQLRVAAVREFVIDNLGACRPASM
jgi:hypothetical protein